LERALIQTLPRAAFCVDTPLVVNGAKTLIERTEVLVLLKQIKLEQKNE